MAVFAVGDVQGCRDELDALLAQAGFDAGRDALWCVGDLVNRGPKSLETLRLFRELGERAVCVLGNHDITLLALAAGHAIKDDRQLRGVLDAPDAAELLDWLRRRPLLHHDESLGCTMVHAGILPQWTLAQAQTCARELEHALRADDWARTVGALYGAGPGRWDDTLTGAARLRMICNVFTRMRYLHEDGAPDWDCKAAPGAQPDGLLPWFEAPGRKMQGQRIVFGHWSTLGYHDAGDVLGLDSGCVWGGQLTLVRLDAEGVHPVQLPCPGFRQPGAP